MLLLILLHFGFTEDNIQDSYITLKFRILESINKKIEKKVEKKLIKEKTPISQSENCDKQKNVSDREENSSSESGGHIIVVEVSVYGYLIHAYVFA